MTSKAVPTRFFQKTSLRPVTERDSDAEEFRNDFYGQT